MTTIIIVIFQLNTYLCFTAGLNNSAKQRIVSHLVLICMLAKKKKNARATATAITINSFGSKHVKLPNQTTFHFSGNLS